MFTEEQKKKFAELAKELEVVHDSMYIPTAEEQLREEFQSYITLENDLWDMVMHLENLANDDSE